MTLKQVLAQAVGARAGSVSSRGSSAGTVGAAPAQSLPPGPAPGKNPNSITLQCMLTLSTN